MFRLLDLTSNVLIVTGVSLPSVKSGPDDVKFLNFCSKCKTFLIEISRSSLWSTRFDKVSASISGSDLKSWLLLEFYDAKSEFTWLKSINTFISWCFPQVWIIWLNVLSTVGLCSWSRCLRLGNIFFICSKDIWTC